MAPLVRRNLNTFGILFLLFAVCIPHHNAAADVINVACASNFKPTLIKLAKTFEQQSDHSIQISSASSGVLYAQINNGAPFQLFFSADALRPEKLITQGKADKTSLTTYAIGRLMLLHRHNNATNIEHITSKAQRIAIANPNTAPYGIAAKSLLNNWDLQKDVQILRGNNIAQALQFFDTGNADIALIAASLLTEQQRQQSIDLTPMIVRPISQKAVLINSQKSTSAAIEFLNFIGTDKAKQIITDSGYLIPL